ncbi:MAG: dihydrofolate reductase family protein [Acetobacteraceae bacterium]
MAGAAARGATAYVTLEPCNHTGPHPALHRGADCRRDRPRGRGGRRPGSAGGRLRPRRLRAAGIEVVTGVLEAEADAMQAGFLTRVRLGRPMVTLKLATTLDGRIATHDGESRWITGPRPRRAGHVLRGTHDAVLVRRRHRHDGRPGAHSAASPAFAARPWSASWSTAICAPGRPRTWSPPPGPTRPGSSIATACPRIAATPSSMPACA